MPVSLPDIFDWLRGYERLWDIRLERLAKLLRHPHNEDSR
jgi:hypothetical protein